MSTVILDTITGKSTATTITIGSTPVVSSSANSMTIRGEGTAQTSIQQGLAKSWSKHDNTGTISITDSFNLASISDIGTGTADFTLTNSFSNTTYSIVATCSDTSAHLQISDASQATGSYRYRTLDGGLDLIDDPAVYGNTHGDLA
jgi:hypothetical protein